MKLSDYVADFLAGASSHVYGVCGGGAMHLNDSIAKHPELRWIATHHEQAAAFAAEAHARVSNQIGLVHVTAGPGVTNTITGVACAWADSLPMMVIAGQVDTSTMIDANGPRQVGISEIDGVALMMPITKYAVCVINPESIRFHLERALFLATNGRKGPVYVEIPLNVQNAEIDVPKMRGYTPMTSQPPLIREGKMSKCAEMLREAKRPVMIVGNGIHLAGAAKVFHHFSYHAGIPILCSWNGADLISDDHPFYIGRPGIIGDRAGNFAVQNADLVIAIGTRLSIPQIGHNVRGFAPSAKKIMVDIDQHEIGKKTLNIDLEICADAGDFMSAFIKGVQPHIGLWNDWIGKCRRWKSKYPVISAAYADVKDGVQSYYFLSQLAKNIANDAIIVTDVGTSFVATMQAMPMSGFQRMFHSPGIAPMGYGLPGAIGAHFGSLAIGGKQIICLTGDGGTMFNLQELQTIVNYAIPVKIFLYANHGYKTMQVTQGNHFSREAVSSPESGVTWPDFASIADAFGIPVVLCATNEELDRKLASVFSEHSGPVMCHMKLSPGQTIMPLVKTKVKDGKFLPVKLEEMWPYLEAKVDS